MFPSSYIINTHVVGLVVCLCVCARPHASLCFYVNVLLNEISISVENVFSKVGYLVNNNNNNKSVYVHIGVIQVDS